METTKYNKELDKLKPFSFSENLDKLKKENNLTEINRLMANENPYGCSPLVKDAVISSLDEAPYYPLNKDDTLKLLISAKHSVAPNEIFIGEGTDEIIALLSQIFLDKSSEMITADITFFSYMKNATVAGANSILVPLKDFKYDLDGIISKITDKTRLISLVNPNNPTGTIFTEKEQEDFLEKVPSHIPVIIDEAYGEFVYDKAFPNSFSMFEKYPNVIILKTFSKIYGMASFRIGYAVSNPNFIELLYKIKTPFNVSSFALDAAIASFNDNDFLNMVRSNNKTALDFTCSALKGMDIAFVPSNTSFLLIDINTNPEPVYKELLKRGYFISSNLGEKLKTYIRVSIGTLEQMQGFIKELKSILNK